MRTGKISSLTSVFTSIRLIKEDETKTKNQPVEMMMMIIIIIIVVLHFICYICSL